jgi:hypothetical protein
LSFLLVWLSWAMQRHFRPASIFASWLQSIARARCARWLGDGRVSPYFLIMFSFPRRKCPTVPVASLYLLQHRKILYVLRFSALTELMKLYFVSAGFKRTRGTKSSCLYISISANARHFRFLFVGLLFAKIVQFPRKSTRSN